MAGITYRCPFCGHETATQHPEPASWALQQAGVPRLMCSHCGRAAAPEQWLTLAIDGHGSLLWDWFFRMWSYCPNARFCSLHDQYDAQCERGLVLQKCFVSIHEQLELIQHFQRHPGQPKPYRQSKRRADSAPDTAGLET